MGFGTALGSFLKCLFNKEFSENVKSLAMDLKEGRSINETVEDVPTEHDLEVKPAVVESTGLTPYENGALQLLSELQKEGRLIDFLEEDLNQYGDEEIGSSVRAIHEGCRNVMNKVLNKTKIVNQEEESHYRVNDDYDAIEVKLSGKVKDTFPQKGVVVHPGWKAEKVHLPERLDAMGGVIAPAEIEIE